jgi:hypothetical protein
MIESPIILKGGRKPLGHPLDASGLFMLPFFRQATW